MAGDVANSDDRDYIMRRIREVYLAGSTVTIVMVGRCTWARKYVDWEIAASLRNNPTSARSGLMAIALPSLSMGYTKKLPPRLADNVDGENGYARWWKYPSSVDSLATCIEIAHSSRQSHGHLAENSRLLFDHNRSCS